MAHGGPLLTPYAYDDGDYKGDWAYSRFHFVFLTGIMASLVVWRDEACVYRRLAIGLGNDGTFESSNAIFDVPVGTESAPGATYLLPQLTLLGMGNISFLGSGGAGQMSYLT